MSSPRVPPPAKLVASILGNADENILKAGEQLEKEFGPADFVSDVGPFEWTDYYSSEMGAPLVRRFFSFDRLVQADRLPEIKWLTNDLEQALSLSGRRTVNIDPGLLTQGSLVLATGKERAHRIYLGRSIFADLTLMYQSKSYHPLPWTYPDYAREEVITYMNRIRRTYGQQLKALRTVSES
ncbi:MAG: DUF4416 family protein [Deltaproteobacteria bacterium]|nr:DUF4416 family protein [Deltaproteobacteria bacterium]